MSKIKKHVKRKLEQAKYKHNYILELTPDDIANTYHVAISYFVLIARDLNYSVYFTKNKSLITVVRKENYHV